MKSQSLIIPGIFFTVNVLLRWIGIEINSLAGDEPFSVYFAQMDISDIIRHLKSGNNPPLYEILLHYWIRIWGIEEVVVRIPSLIFTALTASYMYSIGHRFFNQQVGVVSATVFTFSNYATLFAHEARVYALFGLLTTMSFYYFLKWLNGMDKRWDFFFMVIIYGVLLYAHYFGLMVAGIHVLLALALNKGKSSLKKYGLVLAMSLLLFAPYLLIVIRRAIDTYDVGTWLTPPNGWLSMSYVLTLFFNSYQLVIILILVGLFVGIVSIRRLHRVHQNSIVIIAWFLIPLLGMFGISYYFPMFHDRYLMHSFVGGCLFVGVLFDTLPVRKLMSGALAGIFLSVFIFYSIRNIDNGRHTAQAIEKVQSLKDESTRVILYPKYNMIGYAYYFNRNRFRKFDDDYGYYKLVEGFKDENIYGINQYSEARIDSTCCQKLLFMMTDAGPKEELLAAFGTHYQLKDSFHYPAIIDVYAFERH